MKMKMKFGNLYLVAVLFAEIAVFVSMVWNCKRISEMMYYLMMGMVFIIPCIKEIVKTSSNTPVPVSKPNNTNSTNTSKTDVKQAEKTVTELKNYKKKVCTTKGYQEFNNLFKASIQNKLIKRDDILKVKYELRHLLGSKIEVYIGKNSKFKEFENDAHEINVLSKDSVLKEKDYLYLINLLKNSLDLSSAEEVIEN